MGSEMCIRDSSYLDWVAAQIRTVADDGPELVKRWVARPWDWVMPIPRDHPGEIANRNSEASAVEISVSPSELAEVVERTGARPDEVALLSLAEALADWSGTSTALIDVMGHGRRLPLDLDVSRSIGMFMTYSPVLIERDVQSLERQLRNLRSDLEDGWSFDALRFYGAAEIGRGMAELPRAEVLFNYVGRAIASDADALLIPTEESRGPETDPGGLRDHPIAVRVDQLEDDGLKLVFVYSTRLHQRATIERLALAAKASLNGLGGSVRQL